jgi:hypothetical protein
MAVDGCLEDSAETTEVSQTGGIDEKPPSSVSHNKRVCHSVGVFRDTGVLFKWLSHWRRSLAVRHYFDMCLYGDR